MGAHTRSHPLLNRVSLATAREEAAGSLADLQSRVESAVPALAYPSGACNESVVDILPSCGLKLAFTTRRGINNLRTANPFLLNRINVGIRAGLNVVRSQLVDWRGCFTGRRLNS